MARELYTDDRVRIVRGNEARRIPKNALARVEEVEEMGEQYSHAVKVGLRLPDGRRVNFYARHINRLRDDVINLNDGNPLHKIQIVRVD